MANTNGIWSGLPPWGKGIIAIGIVGVAVVTGVTIYKTIKAASDKKNAQGKSTQVVNSAESGLEALATKNIRPTKLKSQYVSWANELDACFQGWGTCVSFIDIFKAIKNDADMLRLIQEYGVRTIGSGKFNPADGFTGDLPATVVDEIGWMDIADINADFADKKMTFRF